MSSIRKRVRPGPSLVLIALALGAAVAIALVAGPNDRPPNRPQVLAPPVAAGTSAANIALNAADRRVMLRWVARKTGTLKVLHMRIEAGGAQCRLDSSPGYGEGNGGTWHATTHRVLGDGRPDMRTTLGTKNLRPCAGPKSVVDVREGVVGLAMNLPVKKGIEYATVVANRADNPGSNYTSVNFLYTEGGLAGANNRNERDPNAKDTYYGLDPSELVGFSTDAGRSWTMPGTPGDPGYLATYIQEYADGSLAGQPYYYTTPATTPRTMVYPNVPVRWTIRALGAYTPTRGRGTLTLFVEGKQRAQAAVSGVGMIRTAIDPVTVSPGQEVRVVSRGLSIHGIVADRAWGVLLGMNLPAKRQWYLEGEGDSTAAPVYPLPWYGAQGDAFSAPR